MKKLTPQEKKEVLYALRSRVQSLEVLTAKTTGEMVRASEPGHAARIKAHLESLVESLRTCRTLEGHLDTLTGYRH